MNLILCISCALYSCVHMFICVCVSLFVRVNSITQDVHTETKGQSGTVYWSSVSVLEFS